MSGTAPEVTNNATLKVRVPPELKRRLSKVALKRRKADVSELLREVLWQIVESEDPLMKDVQLELSAQAGAPGGPR